MHVYININVIDQHDIIIIMALNLYFLRKSPKTILGVELSPFLKLLIGT